MKKNIFIIMCMLSGFDSFAVNPFISHPFVDYSGSTSAKTLDSKRKMRQNAKPAKIVKQTSHKVLSKKLDDGRVLKFDGKNVIVNDAVKFRVLQGKGARIQLVDDIFSGKTTRTYDVKDVSALNQRLKGLFVKLTISSDGVINLLHVPVDNDEATNRHVIGCIETHVPGFVIGENYKLDNHDVSINADIQVVVDNIAYNIPKKNELRISALAMALKSGGSFNWIDLCNCLNIEKSNDNNYRFKWIQMLRDYIMNTPLKIASSGSGDVYTLIVG